MSVTTFDLLSFAVTLSQKLPLTTATMVVSRSWTDVSGGEWYQRGVPLCDLGEISETRLGQ